MSDIFINLLDGAAFALTLSNLLAIIIGYTIGVIAGSIPGIMAVTAMVLILPFTFGMQPLFAISLLMGCYKGGAYAGSITATLFNIPGTPEAAATCIESYPMTLRGEEARALEIALFASVFGGMVSNLLLIFTAPPLSAVAIKLGPTEIAALILFSLTAVISLLGETRMDIWKGFISVSVGLMLAIVGLDSMSTTRRYVFGLSELDNGITFIVAIIALLALSEVFIQVENTGDFHKLQRRKLSNTKKYTFRLRWRDLKFTIVDLLRSSFLGSLLGALPGIGATSAALISYGESRRAAKDQSMFGKGDPRGIAASESGNNAVAASSLIPLITLGIPGSVAAAVMFGAFMVQGMIPGPMLMLEHPEIIYGLFVLLILTDIVGAIVVALPFITLVRRLFKTLDYTLLFPGVIVCCTVGVYSEEFDPFGLKIMLILGFLGYLMKKGNFSIPPLILAFILGPILERNTRTALLISGGSPLVFFQSPIALTLLVLTALSLFWVIWKKTRG